MTTQAAKEAGLRNPRAPGLSLLGTVRVLKQSRLALDPGMAGHRLDERTCRREHAQGRGTGQGKGPRGRPGGQTERGCGWSASASRRRTRVSGKPSGSSRASARQRVLILLRHSPSASHGQRDQGEDEALRALSSLAPLRARGPRPRPPAPRPSPAPRWGLSSEPGPPGASLGAAPPLPAPFRCRRG